MKKKMANGRPLGIEKLKKLIIRWPLLTKTAKSIENLDAAQNAE